MSDFSDPQAVARYAEGPVRLVPGFHALQRMAELLLAERIGEEASVLVLGAGGGLELKAFAERRPGWRFTGVDPSAGMLDLARTVVGPLMSRVELCNGYIDDAPQGPFHAASCLLTLHFIPAEERLRTLREVRRRLRPGAPLVVAHHSFPQHGDEKRLWLERYAAFAAASGVEVDQARSGAVMMGERLPFLAPEEDEALMRDAGFTDVALFYAAFTFRGWIARA